MAQSGALFLKSAGADVKSKSSIAADDRAESIEFVEFRYCVQASTEGGAAWATGRRTWEEVSILKRLDRASPLLTTSITSTETCEAVFKFYRPMPDGSGGNEQFYTVKLENAYITSIQTVGSAGFDETESSDPPSQRVSFVFDKITMTHVPTGVEHTDSWRGE